MSRLVCYQTFSDAASCIKQTPDKGLEAAKSVVNVKRPVEVDKMCLCCWKTEIEVAVH